MQHSELRPLTLNELWKKGGGGGGGGGEKFGLDMVGNDPHLKPRRRLVDGRTGSQRQTGPVGGWMGVRVVSLDDLEVVQDGHDVLRHEDVAGVNGHASYGDQQGVWRGGVKEELKTQSFIR